MQEENSIPQQATVSEEPTSRMNVFKKMFIRIPKPFFFVLLVVIGIPLLFFILKGPDENSPAKPKSEFRLVESSPSDQQNATPVVARPTFVFSKKIGVSEKDLGKYFSITPQVEGSWRLEKNGKVVYFASGKKQQGTFPKTFEYQTAYMVTVDKSFRSDAGKQLVEQERVIFKTQQNPEFLLTARKSLQPVPVGDSIDIDVEGYTNETDVYANSIKRQKSEPYTITLQKATKEELLSYFVYKKDSYLAINVAPDSLVRRDSIKTSGQFLSKGKDGYSSVIRVTNPAFKTPGIYFVTFSNKYGRDRLFVVASNHVAQVIHDTKKSYVLATDSKSNNALSGVTVEYYKALDSVSLLDTKVTNGDGIATEEKMKEDTDFVVTSKGTDIAVSPTRSYRMFASSDEDVEVFSYTDRPIYRPGDTVHYKAVIRVRNEKGDYSIKRKTYYIKYSTDFNNVRKGNYKDVTTDENGTVTFDTKLPYSETNEYPTITLATKNSKGEYVSLDNLQLLVEFYKKPEMDISVTSKEKEYVSGDTSHMTVMGKTNYGKPLSGIKFTYRVMLVDYMELKDRNDELIEKDIYANYYGGGKELTKGASEFDKNGRANIEFTTRLPDEFVQSQVALLEVTPTIGAIPSFGKIVRLIHRGEFALFFDEIEGNTSTGLSGYVGALDHKNPRQVVGNMKGKLTLTKKEYYSDNGQVIEIRDIELDGKGRAGFTFRNLKEGNYELKSEFTDARGNKVTGIQMAYVGAPVRLSGPTSVMGVSFDKQKYKEGETARATVISNFLLDDVYVVTAENREGSTRIVSVEKRRGEGRTRSMTISVPVKKETGRTTEILLYTVTKGEAVQGQASFSVDRKVEKLKTTISFDKSRYQPGENVKVTLTTKNESGKGVSADNSLSIIDAALLQLGKLKTGIVEQFTSVDSYIAVSYYNSLTGIYADGPGGGGGCFLEGTQILMGDGTTKNIENVRIGDAVLTKRSETSNEMVKNTVEKTFAHTVTEYLLINNRLKVTPIHRLYLNGKWAEASTARVGDMLLDQMGNTVEIVSITKNTGIFRVFNLTTTPSHTFFADGFYVHNEKGMDARQNFVDTLYWNPHIKTDSNGEASVSFKLADNVTTFTAQAFSNTKDSLFGEGTASIVSYKDLTIIPSLAAFYYEHDKPVISVVAQNSTASDMDLTIVSGIKELPEENKQEIHVKGNDLEVIEVPFDLKDIKKNATFIVEARDRSGKVIDSVLMKKQVLPQGNISAFWESFENSYSQTFSPQFPALDVNRIILSVVPNAAAKLFQSYHYFSSTLSSTAGKDLFSYSYILARTRDGYIDPTTFNYAQDVNEFRYAVQALSEKRDEDTWRSPQYGFSGGDTFESANLWVAKGLEQAVNYHMIDEITDMTALVEKTKEYFKNNGGMKPPIYELPYPQVTPPPFPVPSFEPASPTPTMYPTPTESLKPSPTTTPSGIIAGPPIGQLPAPPPYFTDDEKLIRTLVYGSSSIPFDGSGAFDVSPEGVASRILAGDTSGIPTLLALKVLSSKDRYIWDGYTGYSTSLPVVAMVEKGSIEDAEKAIRGISFTQDNYDPLTLYAAIRYAERKNMQISKISFKITVNGENAYEFPAKGEEDVNGYPAYSLVLSSRSSKDGAVHVEVKTGGGIPMYGVISAFSYMSVKDSEKDGNRLAMKINLTRNYRDNENGQSVAAIETGKTGIVVLNSDATQLMKGNKTSGVYAFLSEDALSPNFMYLEQYDAYYNPQFQSVLERAFPPEGGQTRAYTLPESYSEQAVFFRGDGDIGNRASILPYVVFNASGGTYYRPKTSIVFPVLGIIANEK